MRMSDTLVSIVSVMMFLDSGPEGTQFHTFQCFLCFNTHPLQLSKGLLMSWYANIQIKTVAADFHVQKRRCDGSRARRGSLGLQEQCVGNPLPIWSHCSPGVAWFSEQNNTEALSEQEWKSVATLGTGWFAANSVREHCSVYIYVADALKSKWSDSVSAPWQ